MKADGKRNAQFCKQSISRQVSRRRESLCRRLSHPRMIVSSMLKESASAKRESRKNDLHLPLMVSCTISDILMVLKADEEINRRKGSVVEEQGKDRERQRRRRYLKRLGIQIRQGWLFKAGAADCCSFRSWQERLCITHGHIEQGPFSVFLPEMWGKGETKQRRKVRSPPLESPGKDFLVILYCFYCQCRRFPEGLIGRIARQLLLLWALGHFDVKGVEKLSTQLTP